MKRDKTALKQQLEESETARLVAETHIDDLKDEIAHLRDLARQAQYQKGRADGLAELVSALVNSLARRVEK